MICLQSALALSLTAGSAGAQAVAAAEFRRVEFWGGATVVGGREASIVTAYSPPLLRDGEFSSHGGQTLVADTGRSFGFTGGVNLYPSPHVGVQVVVDRAHCAVAGTNGPYAFTLRYLSRQPPDDRIQTVELSRSTAWPDTAGSLDHLSIAFNAVVRLGRPERVNAAISGGPSYHRLSGRVEPLGFTAFHLGGRSVLFEDDYRLAMEIRPVHAIGFDIGAEVSAPVGRRTAVMVGFRYFAAGQVVGEVTPSAILNAEELILAEPIADIAAHLGSTPVRTNLSASRIVVGVKVVP